MWSKASARTATSLRPSIGPARSDSSPAFTAAAGWLALILGLSFYARKRIGVRTWRSLHRFTIAVYLLALVHVVGAGTHGTSLSMLALPGALTGPVVFAFAYRNPGRAGRRQRCAKARRISDVAAVAHCEARFMSTVARLGS
jgi:hypothetical protein